jgi:hypothetical protein
MTDSKSSKPGADLIIPTEIVRDIEKIAPELGKLPPDKRRKIFGVIAAKAIHYQGPIPPAEIIEGWETILEGSANRFLSLVEFDAKSIIEDRIEKRQRDDRYRILSLGAATIIIATIFVGAIYCAAIGQPWIAALLVSSASAVILAAYFKLIGQLNDGAHRPKSEPEDKNKPLPVRKSNRRR